MVVFTTDKEQLLRHFRKDPVLFAYHLGDLDDFYFEYCQWGAAFDNSHRIEDVVLVYTGLDTASVLAFGISQRIDELIHQMLDLFPARFYCHFREATRPLFLQRYRESALGTHMKMSLGTFKPTLESDAAGIVRLDRPHEKELLELYDTAYPGHYFHSRMLETGKYFGCFHNDRLVAVSGIHVCSDNYEIAVLGNITTHPDHRGRGLASQLTSHLTAELVEEKKVICLNVKADNYAAIRCYEQLGFEKVYEYEESLFELE